MGSTILSPGIATTSRFEMTMDKRIIPLIMCGGAGTRLWPASREVRPKQFLPLFGTRSTFQDTLLRVSDRFAVRSPHRHHQRVLSLHGAGAARRDRHRGRRDPRADAARFRSRDRRAARRSRRTAPVKRSCSRSPPTTSCRTMPPSSPRAARASLPRAPGASSPSASSRSGRRPNTATSARAR